MKRRFLKLLKSLKYFNNSFSEVRKIMGDNFISPAEVMRVTKFFYTKKQLKNLRNKLPSKKVLEKLKENNFFLIPTPPRFFSLNTLSVYFPYFFNQRNIKKWYDKESFLKTDKIYPIEWIGLSKEKVERNTTETLNLAETAWLIMILKLTRKVNLEDDDFINTSSKTSSLIVPKAVSIGFMSIDRLTIALSSNKKFIKCFKIK